MGMKAEKMRRVLRVFVSLLLFYPAVLPAAEFPVPEYKAVLPGITYGRVVLKDPAMVYHVVRVNVDDKDLKFQAVKAALVPEQETLGKMAKRVLAEGEGLLALMNSDYYTFANNNRIPWGLHVHQGEMIFSPTRKSAFLVDGQGNPSITRPEMRAVVSLPDGSAAAKVLAVNRDLARDAEGCGLYSQVYGKEAPEVKDGISLVVKGGPLLVGKETIGKVAQVVATGRAAIPEDGFVVTFPGAGKAETSYFKVDKPIKVKLDLTPPAVEAVGGGPRLVRSGRVNVEWGREDLSAGKIAYLGRGRHPRAAIGCRLEPEEVIMVVVEGRLQESRGMVMQELADLMLSLGCWDAMAFDGGRSVGLFLNGKEVVEGTRTLSNAIGVFSGGGKKK